MAAMKAVSGALFEQRILSDCITGKHCGEYGTASGAMELYGKPISLGPLQLGSEEACVEHQLGEIDFAQR